MIKVLRLSMVASAMLLSLAGCSPATDDVRPSTTGVSQIEQTQRPLARAYGSVLDSDLDARVLEITHSPVPEADWPIMQMKFRVSVEVDQSKFIPGDAVEFVFDYSAEELPVIVAMRKTTAKELISAMWPEAANPEKDPE